MKKRFLWLLLAFSLLTSQVCSTVAYANLVVDVETVDVPDVGGEIAPPSVPMTGVELETEGEHTETSTTPQPADRYSRQQILSLRRLLSRLRMHLPARFRSMAMMH